MEQRQFKLAAMALVGLLAAAPLAAEKDPSMGTDVQDSMEDLRSSLGSLSSQVNNLQSAMDKAIVWSVNTDVRYDYAPYKWAPSDMIASGTAANAISQKFYKGSLADSAANGYAGMYVKRAELEATGKISSWAVWNLQFDFAGLKLEDTGVDAKGLDLLPYVSVPGYDWEVKAGLYRQPFGVENQTGSSSIPFPERAIMDGGYSPVSFKYVLGATTIAPPTKLVYERIMGAQLITSHNYGPVGYKLQVAVGDDQLDQDPGNAGASSTTGAFGTDSTGAKLNSPNSLGLTTDEDPSEFGRFGLDLNFVPKILTLNVGGSAAHNSTNSQLLATASAQKAWQDTYGVDATLGLPMAQTVFQGEWVGQNTQTYPGAKAVAFNRAEAWYVESTTKPLALFDKDLGNLDLNLRVENIVPNVDIVGANAGATIASSEQAATVGLKYYYAGKNYTSVNYSTYAVNGDYTALAPASLISVQQQFNF